MKITYELLKKRGACEDQLEIFSKEWPDGTEITLESCKKAGELGLNMDWVAESFLPEKKKLIYFNNTKPAWLAYTDKKRKYTNEYYNKRRPADNEYFDMITEAEMKHEKATAGIRKKLDKYLLKLEKKYKEETCVLFYQAFKGRRGDHEKD